MKFIFKHDSTFDKRKIHILINSKYIYFLLFSFFNESRKSGNFDAIVFNKSVNNSIFEIRYRPDRITKVKMITLIHQIIIQHFSLFHRLVLDMDLFQLIAREERIHMRRRSIAVISLKFFAAQIFPLSGGEN